MYNIFLWFFYRLLIYIYLFLYTFYLQFSLAVFFTAVVLMMSRNTTSNLLESKKEI